MKVLYNWLAEFVDLTLAPAALRDRLSATGTAIEALIDTPAGPLLDAELTINRPDCLGHYGIAREVAAIERRRLRPVTLTAEANAKPGDASKTSAGNERIPAGSQVSVAIECPELCGRYTARVVRGVKVQPSPDWLRRRLESLGQTSINNIVDATNYVMLELGQPLHAFDLHQLQAGPSQERCIVVRRARTGEKMRTLDGIERVLAPEMCVIAGASRAVAIGGVMGGAESEIHAATRDVLLEAAWFDPISIRRTSKLLGLRTEASTRFERGADPEMAETASRRCATLIVELAGGEIAPNAVDLYPGRRQPLTIPFSRAELLRVMGADVSDSEIEAILDALGFAPRRVGPTGNADRNRDRNASANAEDSTQNSPQAVWTCTQPSWRQDATREVDLVEEVARHYGLDKFPARLPASRQPSARLLHAEAEDRLRDRLIGLGYHEIVTIPLVNAGEDALFRAPGAQPAVVANPLAADASVLRSSGLICMARALAWNVNRGQRNVRLFEIGRAYSIKDGAPEETRILTIGATGLAREKSVAVSAREYEFPDLKGDMDQLGELAGGFAWSDADPHSSWQNLSRAGEISLAQNPRMRLPDDVRAGFDSNGDGDVPPLSGVRMIGSAGQLTARVAGEFKLRQDVFLAEIILDPFYEAFRRAREQRRYRPISRFPSVERDFALVLNDGTSFAAVRDVIQSLGIAEIASIDAIDLYRGKQMPAGKFSLLVRVTFQSQQMTLTEAQVNELSARILAALKQQIGAELRTS
jgi:phenylalanyl-tRNA synthetase beta chain